MLSILADTLMIATRLTPTTPPATEARCASAVRRSFGWLPWRW
jgi:hypothetical protein